MALSKAKLMEIIEKRNLEKKVFSLPTKITRKRKPSKDQKEKATLLFAGRIRELSGKPRDSQANNFF